MIIETTEQLIDYARKFSSNLTAFDAMKLTQVAPNVAEWFYENYSLRNKNKSQLDAFNDFYNDKVKPL